MHAATRVFARRSSAPTLRPRLVVTRSARHVFVQVVDDAKGHTLASASTLEADLRTFDGDKTAKASKVGELVAERAKKAGIDAVVFDRGGNQVRGTRRGDRRWRPRGRAEPVSTESDNKEQDVAAEAVETAARSSPTRPRRDVTNEPREARRGGRERNPNRDRGSGRDAEKSQFLERVVTINRVSKVVKGGRRFSFTALVVVGDGNGLVGVGYGKAREVPTAISKGVEEAKKNFFRVPRVGVTIPHPVQGEAAAGVVLLRPAVSRYRCYRRWSGARRARVRRHPRRAEQVARLVEHDQHRARDGRGPASSSRSPVRSPLVVASTYDHVAPARLLRAEAEQQPPQQRRQVPDGRAAEGDPDQVQDQ